MKEREKLSSRLGFILISAGCAVGLGNVWRFPFITGQYGGGAFVLIYLFFLILLGLGETMQTSMAYEKYDLENYLKLAARVAT